MNLFELGILGTVCTAKEDIRYKAWPHFVGKDAHFAIAGVTLRGIYAHTGDIKVDEFWEWPRLIGILLPPGRGLRAWEIKLPERAQKAHRPFLERWRVRAPIESR